MPMTGLGLYGGHRGNRWLRNRIKIFKQFVLPSLLAQTNKNFILWVSFRYEDRKDEIVKEFRDFFDSIKSFRTVFTFSGVCFWDDKYSDNVAHLRLVDALHGAMGELHNMMGESEKIIMTIQPSDDCYHRKMIEDVQNMFGENNGTQVVAYQKGYVMDYVNKRLCEWNPKTNPPFFSICFGRDTFIDPIKHINFTGPYKSHEYVGDNLKLLPIYERGFLVGTHGENISTIFNHPFTGQEFKDSAMESILGDFGLSGVDKLKISISLRKIIMRNLPHNWQRKLRYVLGEKFYQRFYNFIRS